MARYRLSLMFNWRASRAGNIPSGAWLGVEQWFWGRLEFIYTQRDTPMRWGALTTLIFDYFGTDAMHSRDAERRCGRRSRVGLGERKKDDAFEHPSFGEL